MPVPSRLLLLFAASLSLLAVSVSGPAAAQEQGIGSVREVFSGMLARWERVSSYTCLYRGRSLTPNGEKILGARYSFGKPDRVRMEIVEGEAAGTTLLWDGGPRVRVRRSGFWRFFPASLELRNPRLLDPFGQDISASTLKFLVERGAESLREGRLELDADAGRLVLVNRYPEGSGPFAVDRVHLDRESLLPQRIERFDAAGALLQEIAFRELRLDPPLPERHFQAF